MRSFLQRQMLLTPPRPYWSVKAGSTNGRTYARSTCPSCPVNQPIPRPSCRPWQRRQLQWTRSHLSQTTRQPLGTSHPTISTCTQSAATWPGVSFANWKVYSVLPKKPFKMGLSTRISSSIGLDDILMSRTRNKYSNLFPICYGIL